MNHKPTLPSPSLADLARQYEALASDLEKGQKVCRDVRAEMKICLATLRRLARQQPRLPQEGGTDG